MKRQSKKKTKKQQQEASAEIPPEEIEGEDLDRLLAVAIREERKKAGLSTRELSRQIGRSATYIHKIETNQLQTSTTELAKIAKALNRPPGYFFPGVIERKFGTKIGKSELDIIRELKEQAKALLEKIELLEKTNQIETDSARRAP
jgi:transcriptional regulator with XRE-family HTH domain